MRIAILGAGAMGSLVGSYIKKEGGEVYFVDPYEEHMRKVEENGLFCEVQSYKAETVKVDGAFTGGKEIGVCDIVIVLVKSIQTREIIADNKSLFGKDTVVMTFQNGIGNVEILKEFFQDENIGYGILRGGGSLFEPGKIRGYIFKPEENKPNLYFSPLKYTGKYSRVYNGLLSLFKAGGFYAEMTDQMESMVWDKLYINTITNLAPAVLRISIQAALNHPQLAHLLKETGNEVCKVASAKGIPMDSETCWRKYIVPIQNSTKESYSSTAQDVMKKRKTEADFINGAIVREGQKLNIPTPYNDAVWCFTKALEDTYDKQIL